MSTLDRPLHAEFELLQWHNVDLRRLAVDFASEEDFEAFGIERQPYLDEVGFEIMEVGNRRVKIIMTGTTNIREPYLDFLLRLRWPGGSLLREYILLFNPPGMAPPQAPRPRPAPPSAAAAPSQGIEGQSPVSQPAPPPAPRASSARPRPRIKVSDEAARAGRETNRVQIGDSLWDIAVMYRPPGSGISVYQIMVGIHDLNPQAFVNGNITLLKAGQLIQVPTIEEMGIYENGSVAQAEFDYRVATGEARVAALRNSPPSEAEPPMVPEQPQSLGEEADETGVTEPINTEVAPQPEQEEAAVEDELVRQAPSEQAVATQEDMPEEMPEENVTEETAPPMDDDGLITPAVSSEVQPGTAADQAQETLFASEEDELEALLMADEVEIARLEQMVDSLSRQLQESQALAARLTNSLQTAMAQQTQSGQGGMSSTFMAMIALAASLLVVIVLALMMYLRMNKQLQALVAAKSPAAAAQDGLETSTVLHEEKTAAAPEILQPEPASGQSPQSESLAGSKGLPIIESEAIDDDFQELLSSFGREDERESPAPNKVSSLYSSPASDFGSAEEANPDVPAHEADVPTGRDEDIVMAAPAAEYQAPGEIPQDVAEEGGLAGQSAPLDFEVDLGADEISDTLGEQDQDDEFKYEGKNVEDLPPLDFNPKK